jgi:hypothetical protein
MQRSKKILIKSSMDYDFNAKGTIHTEGVAHSGFPILVSRIKPPDIVMCWLAVYTGESASQDHLAVWHLIWYFSTHCGTH